MHLEYYSTSLLFRNFSSVKQDYQYTKQALLERWVSESTTKLAYKAGQILFSEALHAFLKVGELAIIEICLLQKGIISAAFN